MSLSTLTVQGPFEEFICDWEEEILNCGYEEESLNCGNLFKHMEDILNLILEWASSGLKLEIGIALRFRPTPLLLAEVRRPSVSSDG